jgi:hypothetical protein
VAFDPSDVRKAVIALGLGGIAGAAVVQSHHEEERKSEAEKDDRLPLVISISGVSLIRSNCIASARRCGSGVGWMPFLSAIEIRHENSTARNCIPRTIKINAVIIVQYCSIARPIVCDNTVYARTFRMGCASSASGLA